jgi:hypothetical protein
MTSTTSRFADLARWQAVVVVAILLATMAGGFAFRMHNKFLPGATPPVAPQTIPGQSRSSLTLTTDARGGMVLSNVAVTSTDESGDLAMYRRVTSRMIDGVSYYAAVADEHRKAGYPLRPFITVRMPTLAILGSTLGLAASRAVLVVLVLLTALAWWRRLQRITDATSLQPVICLLVVGTGLSTFVAAADLVVSHEVWAATLLALSWAMWGGFRDEAFSDSVRNWLPSVVLATVAVLIRETALPFMLLMAAFAVWHRRWRETAAWGGAVLVFAACLTLHADHVATVVTAADQTSPGWANFSGWPFFVLAMHGASGLRILPEWAAPIVVPLVMLGWASWRSEGKSGGPSDTGAFGFLLFAGYALMFMVLGRPDNWYWGLLLSPVFLLGILFAPQAIVDLVTAIRRGAPVGTSTGISAARAPATGRQSLTTSGRPAAAR